MKSNDAREAFLEFFRSKGHQTVPSAPMVVKNDPTLMFTNAGMNQFKDIFLGNNPVEWPRVADSQKCLRVSGKHNDLEEVGHDTYHHTMFEMLGNWSFGDYFKREAIDWAWELLHDVYKLPAERMYATVFEGSEQDGVERDTEAWELWRQYLPEDHIILGNRKDNFWEMGDTGPCGPCSEIHFDLRSDAERAARDGRELVNASDPHVIEIWNLVFMQFNRKANGSLEPLPARHVDTGMGFERLCMVLQGKQSNYDTDIFQPTIRRIGELSGRSYGAAPKADIAMRVVADHLRAIAFSIADGQLPSNVKAGYVIRRILRRAVRYGYTYLGFTEPFICRLVGTLSEQMGGQYPELQAQLQLIENVIREEESSFLRTLDTGIGLLEGVIRDLRAAGRTQIGGSEAFLLYDTYGFPIDLTELIARENGLTVDLDGFEKALAVQKERSRNDAEKLAGDWVELFPLREGRFVGYDTLEADVRIARYRSVSAKGKSFYQLVFDVTPFYATSGGQVGDTGYISCCSEQAAGDEHGGERAAVGEHGNDTQKENGGGGCVGERYAITDTQKENNLTVHITSTLPRDLTATFHAQVDRARRRASESNHTATHLMHEALRSVLGTHVEQKGSLVTPDYLRFDFSHFQKVTDDELRRVEQLVNARVRENVALDERRDCPIDQAREMGAMMLFGEKYGSEVRVVRFGSSIELCGGTHAARTGNIGLFKIVSEGAISAGVRRIEAVTGVGAEEFIYKVEDVVAEVRAFINSSSIVPAIKKLIDENGELRSRVDAAQKEQVERMVETFGDKLTEENGAAWFVRQIDMNADVVKDIAHALRRRYATLAFVVGSVAGSKATLTVALGDAIVSRGANASEIVRAAAREIEGGGGGQPFFATAGGKNPAGIECAMIAASDLIKNKL